MSVEFSNLALFLIFETFIMMSSIRIFYFITKNIESKINEIKLVIGWISISIILSGIISTIFSFATYNGINQYLITSIILVIVLHISKKSELFTFKEYLYTVFNNVFVKIFDWRVLVVIGALLPVLFISIRPSSTADDLATLNFMFDWIFNESTPFIRPFNYVPFWELSHLPSMTISNSDNFFWLNSFKPMIIIGLGTFLIGRTIKLPKYLVWISVLASILFFKIWFIGNTIGTLKNDYIFAAGIILLIISFIRSNRFDLDRISFIFLTIGVVFVTVKFSGLLLGIIATLIFIFVNRHYISKHRQKSISSFVILFFIFLSTTGLYYLSNTVEYGNPFYPVKVSIFGTELPGNRDLSETSIIANIEDSRIPELLFPTSNMSKGGFLFPVIVIFGFVGTIGLIIFTTLNYKKTGKFNLTLFLICGFVLLSWILYFATPYSAGHEEGSVSYLEQLRSSRYIIGTLFVTELLFVFVLYKLRIPTFAILSIIGLYLLSRYYILLEELPKNFDFSIIIIPILILIGLYFFRKHVVGFRPRMLLLGSVIISIFIFLPFVVEENRSSWVPMWHNVALAVHELPSSEIYIISEPKRTGEIIVRTYPVYGNNFQHILIIGSQIDLINTLNDPKVQTYPQFIVELCHPRYDCKSELKELESDFSSYGYKVAAIDSRAILLKHEN